MMKDNEVIIKWWNGLSVKWKEYLYLNYIFSLSNKYSRISCLCDDSYGIHFLACKLLRIESKDPEIDLQIIEEYVRNKLEKIDVEDIKEITKLSELTLSGFHDFLPFSELKYLNIVILENCQLEDISVFENSSIKHVLDIGDYIKCEPTLESLKTKFTNIKFNELDLNIFYEYFYGDWGHIFNNRFGIELFKLDLLVGKISTINKEINEWFNSKVRHYKLIDHTKLVCKQFEKYFWVDIWSIDPNLFRVFLVIHDIGKPIAFQKGNKGDQYKYTQEIIKSIWDKLPFDENELKIVLKLLEGDTLGEYFQGKLSAEKSVTNIIRLSTECGLSSQVFFKIYMIYYQCDTASYTADAGGLKFLEYLFEYKNGAKVFDEEEGLIRFSTKYWEMYIKLKKEIELCQ